jgi:mannose-1-phosphate guanylyltransferase
MRAMMLTAGLGTRLRPITDHLAKPAVPFLNIPLFFYPISLMEELSISSLVLNTHYKPEQIENLARQIPGAHYPVCFSHENAAPLGSGGGIWKARTLLEGEGSFLVCNGDEVILPHDPHIMRRFNDEHLKHKPLATILVMEHPEVGNQFGGVWADATGRVHGFAKTAAAFPGLIGYHYIGLLLLNDRVFSYLPEGESNILYDALAVGIARGDEVRVVVGAFTWYETGNPRDFLAASDEALHLLIETDRPESQALIRICSRFWSKRTRLEFRGSSVILRGTDSVIDANVHLKGFAILGDGSRLAASGQTVENVVVMPGAEIGGPCANQIIGF